MYLFLKFVSLFIFLKYWQKFYQYYSYHQSENLWIICYFSLSQLLYIFTVFFHVLPSNRAMQNRSCSLTAVTGLGDCPPRTSHISCPVPLHGFPRALLCLFFTSVYKFSLKAFFPSTCFDMQNLSMPSPAVLWTGLTFFTWSIRNDLCSISSFPLNYVIYSLYTD